MRKIKVLHVIGSMDLGGAEKLTKLLIGALSHSEFVFSVCCLKSGGHYAEELIRHGTPVHVLLQVGKHDRVGPIGLVRSAWLLWRLLQQEKPDVVHSHLFLASILSRVVGWLAGNRCQVVTLHRLEYRRWQPLAERLLGGMVRRYVTDSRAAACLLVRDLGIDERKTEFIHNGIDPKEFAHVLSRRAARDMIGLEPDIFGIGIVAHLYKEKGHAFLLETLAAVRSAMEPFKLVIVGDGYLRADLEAQAANSFLSGQVLFLGQRSDLAAILAGLDLLVLPSRWEGFGIILAEAMYMQVPTVTTSDGGGAAEVVENMDGGLLVPYGDHERLGQALVRFRKDEIFRKVQGERGRVRVENHFLVGVMAKKYATMYRRLLAARPESNRTPA